MPSASAGAVIVSILAAGRRGCIAGPNGFK
jgi:hypothetical protein